jgi:[ribosomal protein S5]-alanine N-acetyltransferase
MTPVLLTERLLLRPFEHEDAPALARVLNDRDVASGVCTTPVPFTRLHASASILLMLASEARGQLAWAVETAEGEVAGLVTLTGDAGTTPGMGFAIARQFWGRGFGREAVSCVLEWMQRARPGASVRVEVFADTPAALRLVESLGFTPTGQGSRFSLARGGTADVRLFESA